MITKLLEKVKEAHKRLPEMEAEVYKAVDQLDEKEEPRFPLSPSQALKPMRDIYYSLVNYHKPGTISQDPLPAPTKLTFKFGHYIESLMVEYFREAFQLKDEQKRVVFGHVYDKQGACTILSGAIDWAIKVNGETILMDSKSSGSYPFKLAPKEDNIAQMQLYMHSDWGRKNNVNKAILAYFNKDNSDIKCIQVDYNAELAEALLQRLYKVWDYFIRGELPPREYVLGVDWQSNYSSFRTHDFAEFNVPLELRPILESTSISPPSNKESLKAFVLTYGNAVVNFRDKSVYVTLGNKGLDMQVVGEKIWKAV